MKRLLGLILLFSLSFATLQNFSDGSAWYTKSRVDGIFITRNVAGVGTTTPNERLHVRGNVKGDKFIGDVSANNVDVNNYYSINGTDVNVKGTWSNIVYKDQDNVFTGVNTFLPARQWVERSSAGPRYWWRMASSGDGNKIASAVEFGYIYTSNDSGATWQERTGAGDNIWYSIVYSSDGSTLIAGEFNGYLHISTDDGATWTSRATDSVRTWTSIACSSDGSKIVAGTLGGSLWTSTDSGVTWTERTSAGTHVWYALASSQDGTRLVAAAQNDYIYTSTDSGATWTAHPSSGQKIWYSLGCSSDGFKIFASASFDYPYVSIDGGANWVTQNTLGYGNWRPATSSFDGLKLAIAKYQGYIYTSNDGGNTWVEQTEAGVRNWTCMASSSDGTKLVAGTEGTYIFTSNDNTSIGGDIIVNNITANGTLYVSGNTILRDITANYYYGDGSNLRNIITANYAVTIDYQHTVSTANYAVTIDYQHTVSTANYSITASALSSYAIIVNTANYATSSNYSSTSATANYLQSYPDSIVTNNYHGDVTANYFIGNGSKLTNITSIMISQNYYSPNISPNIVTPDSVGQIWVNTTNYNIFMAAHKNNAGGWAYLGQGASQFFAATNVTGLSAWYKADVGVTYDGGNAVSQWDDQSGNGKHLTQGTAANKPIYTANLLNGLPGITFDGSNDTLTNESFVLAQPYTIFLILKHITIDGTQDVYFQGNTNLQVDVNTDGKQRFFAGTTAIGTTVANTSPKMITVVGTGTNSSIQINNASAVTGNAGTTAFAVLRLAQYNAGNFWNGNYYEILVYSGALSAENITIVQTYLNNKWAIY